MTEISLTRAPTHRFIRRPFARIAWLFASLASILLLPPESPAAGLDSVESLYIKGTVAYDSMLLQHALRLLDTATIAASEQSRRKLLCGLSLWRLQLIAFCLKQPKSGKSYGLRAAEALEAAGKDPRYAAIALAHRILVYQLLASTGLSAGAIYGPQTARLAVALEKSAPGGYFTRLVQATSALETPPFAGGSPAKALLLLQGIRQDHPDSAEAAIHLARAHFKTGAKDSAAAIIRRIVGAQPQNLFAHIVKEEVEKDGK
jgi:hypothetical protein